MSVLSSPASKYRMSWLLTLYITKQFILTLLVTTLLLALFVMVIDYVELARRLSGKGIDLLGTVYILFLRTPDLMFQILPFAVLIGTLICFTKLSKHHELIAMRSTGLPARLFLRPAIISALIIGALTVSVFNPFAAVTLKTYHKIESTIFPGKARGFLAHGGDIWLRQSEQDHELIISAKAVLNEGTLLKKATIFVNDLNGQFNHRIDSPQMRLRDGRWLLDTPVILRPQQEAERKASMTLPTTLTPETIRNSFNSPRTLPIWDLYSFIQQLKKNGFPTVQHEMHFQSLLAMPALIFVMFLLAVPFALQFSRNKGVLSITLIGIAFGFIFYLFSNFIATYGLSGRLNVIIAAWLPTVIAALISLATFLHFREE